MKIQKVENKNELAKVISSMVERDSILLRSNMVDMMILRLAGSFMIIVPGEHVKYCDSEYAVGICWEYKKEFNEFVVKETKEGGQ